MDRISEFKVMISPLAGKVSCILNYPEQVSQVFLLAHGAGAGMRHAFIQKLAGELATLNIATLRYQFPYMEQGKRTPDKPATAYQTIQAVFTAAREQFKERDIFLAGKSYGGRMSSQAVANHVVDHVSGIVFYGFPLHPPGKPSTERADHLIRIKVPMLFLQGSDDKLADISLMKETTGKLGDKARMQIFEHADHSFQTPKSLNIPYDQTIRRLAEVTKQWLDEHGKRKP